MAEALKPAAELAAATSRPYPNEPAGYRAAREALIAEEIELRRHLERVAAQRRALPLGGEVPEEYAFEDQEGGRVRLSEMFGRHDTLITYFWMYGPQRERPCPMCTNLLGGRSLIDLCRNACGVSAEGVNQAPTKSDDHDSRFRLIQPETIMV